LHRSRVRFEVAEHRGAFWKEYSRFMGMASVAASRLKSSSQAPKSAAELPQVAALAECVHVNRTSAAALKGCRTFIMGPPLKRAFDPLACHERGRWRNNRAENSHQPTRRRERKMQGFKSLGSAQRFLSTHAAAYNNFNVQRHLISASTHRVFRALAMNIWRAAVAVA
jgi:hypothetical protein